MTTILEKITVYSEDGDRAYPNSLGIQMDGSQPNCPVTFYDGDGKPVFSMAADEISGFIKELVKMDPTQS